MAGPEDDDLMKKLQEQVTRGERLPEDHVNITLYKNGFTVGDGPFRPLTDPLNKKFMDEVSTGRCPEEIAKNASDAVHVALTDKRGEDYKGTSSAAPPAKKEPELFVGSGNTLGGSSGSSAPAAAVQTDQGSVTVDSSKAKTKIQVRFHNGEKKAQEFNEDHTVGDLRAFVSQCVGGQAMTIMGGFPPKPLTNDGDTLKAAGLCGASITARPT
eukprot:TRINITY_DN117461_c0_g1_i1.p1 TRINITY_DN117461_c0_g1~~TRINITY_DN117461_c0_g1_i1.p1  ORF type:complete len:213 (+),score=55.29 TRINITY_DN117461_c0_g1_i1:87-725(+)